MQDLGVQVLASVHKFSHESSWVYTWGVSLGKAELDMPCVRRGI